MRPLAYSGEGKFFVRLVAHTVMIVATHDSGLWIYKLYEELGWINWSKWRGARRQKNVILWRMCP